MPDVAQTYTQLAFGIEPHLPGYIDGYFGPEAWKRTDKRPLDDLERDAKALAAEVAGLEDASRRTFLAAQVQAMQTSISLLPTPPRAPTDLPTRRATTCSSRCCPGRMPTRGSVACCKSR